MAGQDVLKVNQTDLFESSFNAVVKNCVHRLAAVGWVEQTNGAVKLFGLFKEEINVLGYEEF